MAKILTCRVGTLFFCSLSSSHTRMHTHAYAVFFQERSSFDLVWMGEVSYHQKVVVFTIK